MVARARQGLNLTARVLPAPAALETLFAGSAHTVPTDPRELEALLRLWEREAILSRTALLLACDELDPADAMRAQAVIRLVEGLGSRVILAGRERRKLRERSSVARADLPIVCECSGVHCFPSCH